ncbi:MAG: TIGR01777 family protein, partial [Candidatus Melainabacteria bacterium HGW-Melainabacteria-1]
EQWLDESDSAGNGFLSEVCRQWESAAEAVEHCGIRRVSARIGLVLSAQGGALSKMLLPFQLGLGGELGNGKQYLSWISREDTIRALLHCVQTPSLQGPVNLCAPMPVSNREFTRVLGRVLHRPALFKVPAVALKLGMGAEMAQELLLASARVKPTQLLNSGFVFRYPELEAALRQSLGK